jgi:hypothetical protein
MATKVTVRVSLNKDSNSIVRAAIWSRLKPGGFTKPPTKTATWKTSRFNKRAAHALAKVIALVENPQSACKRANPQAALDHLWIYVEKDIRKKKRPTVK